MSSLTLLEPRGARDPRRRGVQKVGVVALSVITFLALSSAAFARGAPESFADLAAKVTPSVVNISTEMRRTTVGGNFNSLLPDLPKDSPFYDLFRRFGQGPVPHTERMRALGSGFIVDSAGYVVTNNHVIDGADRITVTLQNGRKYKAKLVGRDTKTDIALLKFEGPSNLTAVEFADSDKARVGDWVLAVGNPFGLGGTVTAGIVSARNRDIHSGPYDDYLQVDASTNKGNSGGPLFDMDGKVLGINTAIYSPNGGSVGIGFAIPASVATSVIAQLREHGSIERGWLGVSVQPVTDDIAKALGLESARGGLIAQVQEGSPAAKAGLRVGDVILVVDGKAIEHSRDLPRIIAALKNGTKVDFKVWRDGKEISVKGEIGRQAQEPVVGADDKDNAGQSSYGLVLAPLTPAARETYDVPRSVQGVVIASVVPGGPAAEKGLKPGDVIVRVGNERVSDLHSAMEKLARAKAEGRTVMLLICHRGESGFVAIRAGQV